MTWTLEYDISPIDNQSKVVKRFCQRGFKWNATIKRLWGEKSHFVGVGKLHLIKEKDGSSYYKGKAKCIETNKNCFIKLPVPKSNK